jgi:hypothetical protein
MKGALIVIGSLAVAVAVAAKIMHDRLARHCEGVGTAATAA